MWLSLDSNPGLEEGCYKLPIAVMETQVPPAFFLI